MKFDAKEEKMKKYLLMTTALLCMFPINSLASDDLIEDSDFTEDDVYIYDLPLDIDNYDDSILTNTSYKFYYDKIVMMIFL